MCYKKAKTLEEQLLLLESRGLTIQCRDFAKNFLLKNNYYRVSGYSLTLRKEDTFYQNTTFQNIVDIYNFDCALRNIILKYIEIIETKFKSVFAYHLVHAYGPNAHLNSSLFGDDIKYHEIIENVQKTINKNKATEPSLSHFVDNLGIDVPFWVFIDSMSISEVSKMYKLLSDENISLIVANDCFEQSKVKPNILLSSHMWSITILRNMCAHGSRIYNKVFYHKPSLSKHDKLLLIRDENGILDNGHLYGFILNMKDLLTKQQIDELKENIVNLTIKIPFVNLKYYGFREDWNKML